MSFGLYPIKMIEPKPDHAKAWAIAISQLGENQREKVPDRAVICMLYDVYVLDKSAKEVADDYAKRYNVDKSYTRRIISPKSGWDSSRRPFVRCIFRTFLQKIGMEDPFVKHDPLPKQRIKYNTPHHVKDPVPKPNKGFGILEGADDGN